MEILFIDPLHGKMGISRWRLMEIEGERSRVDPPLTGRTHQLRLHAAYLAFHNPLSGQKMSYHSPPSF